jgi:hypothetical protein
MSTRSHQATLLRLHRPHPFPSRLFSSPCRIQARRIHSWKGPDLPGHRRTRESSLEGQRAACQSSNQSSNNTLRRSPQRLQTRTRSLKEKRISASARSESKEDCWQTYPELKEKSSPRKGNTFNAAEAKESDSDRNNSNGDKGDQGKDNKKDGNRITDERRSLRLLHSILPFSVKCSPSLLFLKNPFPSL